MSALTAEQSARFHELSRRARRPRWVRADAWEDIKAGTLSRCFEPSKKRKPVEREPPPKLAEYLKRKGKAWDSVAYFWVQRLREELDIYKTRDREPELSATRYGAATFQAITNSAEHEAIAEETADAIYASLPDDAAREIVRLVGLGHSAREIERLTGFDRSKVARLVRGIEKIVGETDFVGYSAVNPSIAADADSEYFPRSYVLGPPAALRDPGNLRPSSDWTIDADLARLLPPREPRPHRPVRSPEELAAGRAEVKQAVANIEARERAIKARETWLSKRLDDLDPDFASLGAMEREFALRMLKAATRPNRAATQSAAVEEEAA